MDSLVSKNDYVILGWSLMNYAGCCRYQIRHNVTECRMFSSSLKIDQKIPPWICITAHPWSSQKKKVITGIVVQLLLFPEPPQSSHVCAGFPGSCLGRRNRSKLSPHLIQLLPSIMRHSHFEFKNSSSGSNISNNACRSLKYFASKTYYKIGKTHIKWILSNYFVFCW